MRRFFTCLFAPLWFIAIAMAEGGGGTIQGTVTDPTGAILAGASVTAVNVQTGVETSFKTTEAGLYVLKPLQPGEYTLTVQAVGFQTLTQKSITVAALQTVGFNPTLQVGSTTESVVVSAAPPL
jgi:hypothetical protein